MTSGGTKTAGNSRRAIALTTARLNWASQRVQQHRCSWMRRDVLSPVNEWMNREICDRFTICDVASSAGSLTGYRIRGRFHVLSGDALAKLRDAEADLHADAQE
jgi:2-polyprenyl-3-methyl-5-hydroxy-6-metoxy-1,4-benzoquinol methylase